MGNERPAQRLGVSLGSDDGKGWMWNRRKCRNHPAIIHCGFSGFEEWQLSLGKNAEILDFDIMLIL